MCIICRCMLNNKRNYNKRFFLLLFTKITIFSKTILQNYIVGLQCHAIQIRTKLNCSIDKCRIWEKKEGKIQVTAIVLKQDMRIYFFTPIPRDLYEEAMLVPIQMGTNKT